MSADILPDLLAHAHAEHGDHIAVDDGERVLTYAELAATANRLAYVLRRLGVVPGDRVALLLPKGIPAVVAVHGVLNAGAVYVPLDLPAPPTRIAHIVADCGIRVLITVSEETTRFDPRTGPEPPIDTVIVLDNAEAATWDRCRTVPVDALLMQPSTAPDASCGAEDPAYVLYTSGSTGTPKGVVLSHRNALAFVEWAADYFGLTSADRLASPAPLHFDLSVFDLFVPVRAGACTVPVPGEITAFPAEVAVFLREREITLWYSVPSALIMLGRRGGLRRGNLPALRSVLFAGEVFPAAQLHHLMSILDGVGFHNLYGPTETNVCTCYTLPDRPGSDGGPVPIGTAASGARLSARNGHGDPVPVGSPGELYVTGPTVMLGYWNAPELTVGVLVNEPAEPGEPSERTYRTGDIVRCDPDGVWHFIGRRDDQVKSRGYRIELGEVEAALLACPSVVEGVVVAVPDELITNRIVAFVTVAAAVSEAELTRSCARRLPRHMIPEPIRVVPELPRTSTGKVDRAVLTTTTRENRVERTGEDSSVHSHRAELGRVAGGADR